MRIISKNLVLTATLTASSENVHFPLENLQNVLRSKRFRSTDKTDFHIIIDLGSIANVDSFIMLLPLEGKVNMTNDAVIKLQANSSDSWDTPAVDLTLEHDVIKRQISHYFSEAQAYRYWRITVNDPTAESNYIEISKLIIGASVTFPNAQNGFKFGKDDGTKITRNDFGTAYADKYPILKTLNLSYKTLLLSEIEVLDNVFNENGNNIPVFITLDETNTLFDKDRYSIYGLMQDTLDMNHVNYNILDSSGLKITELN